MRDEKRLLIVGGGPAGLAAAMEAARYGMSVTLVDEAAALGGQYFRGRQQSSAEGSPRHFARHSNGVEVLLSTAVVDAPADGVLEVWDASHGVQSLRYEALLIATGAYDRTVALPGWTLPGVLTAGAASTLAKAHGVAPGKRLIVAGSGPFLLSVADDLSKKGCTVRVVEATPLSTSIRGLPTLFRDGVITRQTFGYLSRLAARGVRREYGRMITCIHGHDRVEAATIQKVDEQWRPIPGTETVVEADGVCLGFGFVPQLELAQALGCAIEYDEGTSDFRVRTVDAMRTSQPRVYAAGEVTSIGGVRVAMAEGRLAGLTAAHEARLLDSGAYAARAQRVNAQLRHVRRVAEWLRNAFRPRAGLWSLAESSTVVCRCEDVRVSAMESALQHNPPTPYAVKTATRAGMGLCQGRICSPYLIEWLRARHGFQISREGRPWRIRPPLRPVPLADWPA